MGPLHGRIGSPSRTATRGLVRAVLSPERGHPDKLDEPVARIAERRLAPDLRFESVPPDCSPGLAGPADPVSGAQFPEG